MTTTATPRGQTRMQTAVLTLPGSINGVLWRDLGRIGGGAQGCCGHSDGRRGGDDNGMGMGGSSCGKVVVAVSASGFGLVGMSERI